MKRHRQKTRSLTREKRASRRFGLPLRRVILPPFLATVFSFRRRAYRLVGRWFRATEEFLQEMAGLPPHASNPISRLLRPWMEHQRVRGVFGAQLVAALVLFGFFGTPVSAEFPTGVNDSSDSVVEVLVVEAPKTAVVTTERQYQMPVELIGVSQGFQRYHPGVDLRAPLSSDIRPVTEGVVREVIHNRWGYGQAVIVEHASGYSSMYAHVGRIFVEAGSDVDKDSVIAEIGMTGYSTGPHLHLEIYEDGRAINPRPLLGY